MLPLSVLTTSSSLAKVVDLCLLAKRHILVVLRKVLIDMILRWEKKRCFIHNDVCSFTYYMFQIYQKNKLMKALGEELELILNAFSVLFNYISSFTPSISKNISYLENTEKLLHKMIVVIFGIRLGTFVLF